MEFSLHHAKSCLETYLGRGREAVQLLVEQKLDQAFDVLKWRRAAFCNFRVIDQALLSQHPEYLSRPEMKKLWLEIQEIDQKLEQLINSNLVALKSNMAKIADTRGKIQKFRSGQVSGVSFKSSF